MAVEPWKVMIGLSVLLIVIGTVLHLGITEPTEFAALLLFGVLFLALTWMGYRFGKLLGERKADE